MGMTRKIAAAMALMLLWTACAFADGALDAIKARGKLLVGTRDTKERFSFPNAEGKLEGLDVDLANAIGEALGLPVEFVVYHDFAGIKAAWEGDGFKNYDIAISAITIKKDREEKVDFSEAYFTSGSAMMVLSSAPYKAPDELGTLRIGVIEGTTAHQFASEKYSKATMSLFKDYPDEIQGLRDGKVDAILGDFISLKLASEKDESVRVFEELLMREKFGVAMPKGSVDLKAIVDKVVETRKKDLYKKWFKN